MFSLFGFLRRIMRLGSTHSFSLPSETYVPLASALPSWSHLCEQVEQAQPSFSLCAALMSVCCLATLKLLVIGDVLLPGWWVGLNEEVVSLSWNDCIHVRQSKRCLFFAHSLTLSVLSSCEHATFSEPQILIYGSKSPIQVSLSTVKGNMSVFNLICIIKSRSMSKWMPPFPWSSLLWELPLHLPAKDCWAM